MIRYEDFLNVLKGAQDKGKYIAAVCPFHSDKAPSLLVYKDGWFRCLGATCGRVGHWQQLWDKTHGQPIQLRAETQTHYTSPAYLGRHETKEEQAYKAHDFLSQFSSFAFYFEMRGLHDIVDRHELGYIEGWYTFPVRDRNGNYVTTVYRTAPHVQKVNGERYWCGSAPAPYVPDWHRLDTADHICVVYGMLDALTLDQLRMPVMTTTAGANTFKSEWLDDQRKKIYIIPDKGEEKAALLLAAKLGVRGKVIYLDFPEGAKDCNDFLQMGLEKDLIAQLSRKIR